MTDRLRIDSQLVHAGEEQPRVHGAVALPIFQSATFETAGDAGYHDIRYMRLSNTPNHEVVQRKLAALEGTESALVAASGMAAITTTILSVVAAGDHILAQGTLYGGTHAFIAHDLARFGIEHDFIDADAPDSWADKLKPNTRAIYVESITNPLMQVGELAAVPVFARKHALVSMIDNTFPSPINFRPAEHGFDLVLHSGTKYLNGHTDIVAGAVLGSAEQIREIKLRLDHLGGSLDTHACFLLHRGLKTLALRVRRQNANALRLAGWLEQQPAVARVNYPGLASHPQHGRATELFEGCGGMLSFELRAGLEAAVRFAEGLKLAIYAPSLGGVETLVTLPANTSHRNLSPRERAQLGIADGLVRVSTGIEDVEDLIADLGRSLEALPG